MSSSSQRLVRRVVGQLVHVVLPQHPGVRDAEPCEELGEIGLGEGLLGERDHVVDVLMRLDGVLARAPTVDVPGDERVEVVLEHPVVRLDPAADVFRRVARVVDAPSWADDVDRREYLLLRRVDEDVAG